MRGSMVPIIFLQNRRRLIEFSQQGGFDIPSTGFLTRLISSILNLKIMKIHFLSKIAPLVVMTLFSLTVHAQGISDSIAIQSILQEEVVSWNKGDAKVYSQHFAEDGTFTNILGIFYIGHAEFLSRHEQIFKGIFSGTTFKQDLISLKFVNKDV